MKTENKISETMFQNELNKIINNKNGFMNNAKWYKLFETLIKLDVKYIKVKKLMGDTEGDFILHENGFNKIRFDDDSSFGPFQFKEIEWIKISDKIETEEWRNGYKNKILLENNININEIEKMINNLGKFEYEYKKDEIKIYGYK